MSVITDGPPLDILLVEDSPADVRLTREALAEGKAKPVDLDQFFGIIKVIDDFWLTVVKLPAEGH